MAWADKLESLEGAVNGPTRLDLAYRSEKITLTNDHATESMSFRFDEVENYITLYAEETLNFDFSTMTIYIDGNNVPYRIWAYKQG